MQGRPFALAAVILLAISAFGGLSVGIPLVVAQVSGPFALEPSASHVLVPMAVAAYGLLSTVGAVAMVLAWPRATILVVVPQGTVALGLLTIWVAVTADPSLLVVAGIAGGAATGAVLDRRSARRR